MPKLAADQAHADDTAAQLHEHAGLQHLRVRKHGAAIIIESGPQDDPVRHARVVRESATLWDLEIADHRGRWESSGLRATRSELIDTLIQNFGWVLTDIGGENPERTSDPKY